MLRSTKRALETSAQHTKMRMLARTHTPSKFSLNPTLGSVNSSCSDGSSGSSAGHTKPWQLCRAARGTTSAADEWATACCKARGAEAGGRGSRAQDARARQSETTEGAHARGVGLPACLPVGVRALRSWTACSTSVCPLFFGAKSHTVQAMQHPPARVPSHARSKFEGPLAGQKIMWHDPSRSM